MRKLACSCLLFWYTWLGLGCLVAPAEVRVWTTSGNGASSIETSTTSSSGSTTMGIENPSLSSVQADGDASPVFTGSGFTGAGGDISLSDFNASGAMAAGRDVRCLGCRIDGNVSAGRDIYLDRNPQVGSVAAGHNVLLLNSHVLGSVSAGHGVTLTQTQVQGSLSTGNEASLQASAVQGSVSQGGHHLKMDASTVQQNVYFQGESSQPGTTARGSVFYSRVGVSVIQVGEHSLSRLNGYTVQGAAGQTTVITPQQAIYVNGRKVSGDGPKTYGEYRAKDPSAPSVAGPGWPLEETATTSVGAPANQEQAAGASKHPVVTNWLELSHNSQINGQVVFESGFGKVLLHPGSRIAGQVVNGTVEKLPN